MNGTDEIFNVVTDPPGATVTTTLGGGNSAFACEPTPCGFLAPRKSLFVATIEQEGYHPIRVVVRNSEFRKQALNELTFEEDDSEVWGDLKPAFANIGAGAAASAVVLNVDPITTTVGSSTALSFAVVQGLIVAAPIAITADQATGSLNNLYPNPIAVRMIPSDQDISTAQAFRRASDDQSLILADPGEN